MIWEKTLCIALGMVAGVAIIDLSLWGWWLLVRHLVARKLRNERAARKRLDITRILEERK